MTYIIKLLFWKGCISNDWQIWLALLNLIQIMFNQTAYTGQWNAENKSNPCKWDFDLERFRGPGRACSLILVLSLKWVNDGMKNDFRGKNKLYQKSDKNSTVRCKKYSQTCFLSLQKHICLNDKKKSESSLFMNRYYDTLFSVHGKYVWNALALSLIQ